tara:strand:+ start:2283 stop:3011 length:729 start_codon:yes stop_codon:yes gene_type:complete
MKIGDLLLLKGVINKKQLQIALSKQAEEAITYNRSVPLGKILIEQGHVSVDEIAEVLNAQQEELKVEKEKHKKEKPMATEIGENSKFTFDLKFMVTIGAVIVSACATYFSITGQIEELKANNSPNRLEHEYVVKEVENIKSMGDLKIISYKLDEYDETFKELKTLSTTLSPLAADLTYIKEELEKLRNKKVDIPEVDLSGIDDCKNKLDDLSNKITALQGLVGTQEERITKLEGRKSGGSRF